MVRRWLPAFLMLSLLACDASLAPSPPGRARAYFPDVGQGQAVAVVVSRTCVLVDAGPPGDSLEVDRLAALPCDSFAAVLLTHWDLDHRGGLEALLADRPVGEILYGRLPEEDSVLARLAKACRMVRNGCRSVRDGEFLNLLPGVSWTVLSIGPDSLPEGNATSVVSRFADLSGSLLVAGDLDTVREQELALADPGALRSDLLLLSHHGSAGSNSLQWLGSVRPRLSVVQAGKGNAYGHPTAAVRERLSALGIALWNTAELGGVSVFLDGSGRAGM